MKRKDLSEHEIQKAILDYLAAKHIFHYRQNTGGAKFKGYYVRFGVKGAPDIVAVIRGHFFGIEVKTAKGEQSFDQIVFAKNLRDAGGTYLLVRSLDDVIEIFGGPRT